MEMETNLDGPLFGHDLYETIENFRRAGWVEAGREWDKITFMREGQRATLDFVVGVLRHGELSQAGRAAMLKLIASTRR